MFSGALRNAFPFRDLRNSLFGPEKFLVFLSNAHQGCLNSFYLHVCVGLQHLVLFPESPYGMPLDFTILPQKLKESGLCITYELI